jgi:hypothetical protein
MKWCYGVTKSQTKYPLNDDQPCETRLFVSHSSESSSTVNEEYGFLAMGNLEMSSPSMYFFALLPADLVSHFHEQYLAKEMDIYWHPLLRLRKNITTHETDFMFYAGCNGYIKLIEYGLRKFFRCEDELISVAISNNQLVLLAWLFEHGHKLIHDNEGSKWDYECLAASHGHLEILQWLHKTKCNIQHNGLPYIHKERLAPILGCEDECTLHESLFSVAVYNGHVNVLSWLVTVCEPPISRRNLLSLAAENGHVSVVKWLMEVYDPLNTIHPRDMVTHAYNSRSIPLLQYFMDIGWFEDDYNRVDTTIWVGNAIRMNDLDLLIWFKQNNFAMNIGPSQMDLARSSGHMNIIEWIRDTR